MSSSYACLSVDEIRSSMKQKGTRVILAADLLSISEISNLLNEVGDYICTVSYTHLTLPTKRIV